MTRDQVVHQRERTVEARPALPQLRESPVCDKGVRRAGDRVAILARGLVVVLSVLGNPRSRQRSTKGAALRDFGGVCACLRCASSYETGREEVELNEAGACLDACWVERNSALQRRSCSLRKSKLFCQAGPDRHLPIRAPEQDLMLRHGWLQVGGLLKMRDGIAKARFVHGDAPEVV